ncbi:MAG: DUF4339 domain-containing protein [Verrucomicrobia bacterium]|nr:DUF4339 domain-containing protein [Verrucomicrobiota bacterium]
MDGRRGPCPFQIADLVELDFLLHALRMTEWHYVTPEKTHQAFSEEQIPSLVANGTIRSATLIWNGAMTDWKPAGEVKPEWFEMFSTIPDQTAQPTTFQIDVANVPPPFQSPAAMNQTDPIAMGSLVCGIMAIALVLAGCAFPCLGFLDWQWRFQPS